MLMGRDSMVDAYMGRGLMGRGRNGCKSGRRQVLSNQGHYIEQQKSVLYGCGVPSMWVRVSGKVLSVESNFLVQARLNRFRVVLHIQESLKV